MNQRVAGYQVPVLIMARVCVKQGKQRLDVAGDGTGGIADQESAVRVNPFTTVSTATTALDKFQVL